jgi:hypothetical protein
LFSTLTNYSNLININFPVSGADNNIQGFHTNFSNTKRAIEVATTELASIRQNGVYLTENNEFNGTITNATLTNCLIVLKGYEF